MQYWIVYIIWTEDYYLLFLNFDKGPRNQL